MSHYVINMDKDIRNKPDTKADQLPIIHLINCTTCAAGSQVVEAAVPDKRHQNISSYAHRLHRVGGCDVSNVGGGALTVGPHPLGRGGLAVSIHQHQPCA